jgi:hypothetical protein
MCWFREHFHSPGNDLQLDWPVQQTLAFQILYAVLRDIPPFLFYIVLTLVGVVLVERNPAFSVGGRAKPERGLLPWQSCLAGDG